MTVKSQPVFCPPNLDFEYGNFSLWECRTGTVQLVNGSNEITWTDFARVSGRHELIPFTDTDRDFYGGFPRKCPNGSNYSIKLGNDLSGNEAEAVAYSFDIPATATNFSLLYHYAIVMQDPNHPNEEQPRFKARVLDAQTGEELSCVTFDFTASSSLPGFQLSQTSPNVVYKGWTPISVNLDGYAGRSILLEFITSDCTRGGHFGYAYFDVSSTCDGTIQGSAICGGATSITLSAPVGFESYQWFSNTSFTTQVGNQQNLTLSPLPNINAIYPVVVNPYPGFGCVDTIYATIYAASNPTFDAGADRTICSRVPSQLGGAANPVYTYTWSPANYLDNPNTSNPFTLANMTAPVEFIVKTTDVFTGCYSYDTVLITPIVVDTAATVAGKLIYCPGENGSASFSLNNSVATIQWYKNDLAIPGANGMSYQTADITDNTYYAVLQQNGCTDTSRSFRVYTSAAPDASFEPEGKVICINRPASFLNKTTTVSNEQLSYEWEFSDGVIMNDKNISRIFTTPGSYTLNLTATAPGGCSDEQIQTFTVTDNCGVYIPTGFTPNKDGLNDKLIPLLSGVKNLKRFSVFNRYGNLVYSTNIAGEGWDGTYKSILQPTGVYVWTLEYVGNDDKTVSMRGIVSLIR
jgi:gliding motility-associated-like protein